MSSPFNAATTTVGLNPMATDIIADIISGLALATAIATFLASLPAIRSQRKRDRAVEAESSFVALNQNLDRNFRQVVDSARLAAGLDTSNDVSLTQLASRYIYATDWKIDEPLDLSCISCGIGQSVPVTDHFIPKWYSCDQDMGSRTLRLSETYSRTIRKIDDLASYRLLAIKGQVSQGAPGPTSSETRTLELGRMTYFDGFDSWKALELDAAWRLDRGLGLDGSVREPTNKEALRFDRRNCALGISVLTIRRNSDGTAQFYLQRRKNTASMTGRVGLLPAGEFQPAGRGPLSFTMDMHPWRCIMREYVEEFLDYPPAREPRDSEDDWAEREPYKALQTFRETKAIRPYVLDIGVDPLSLKAGMRVVCIFDRQAFDEVFAEMVKEPMEGPTIAGASDGLGPPNGIPFTEENVRAYLTDQQMTEAALLCIQGAWIYRSQFGLNGRA